ncbi:MAG: vitamin B12 dependent-methionine synthase activation domain-containing protein, partial [Kiloniellaceae bacterium]
FQFHWGYRKNGRSLDAYMTWARRELRPVLKRMLDVSKQHDILVPQAVYGYWPAAAEGNDIVLFDPAAEAAEAGRFTLPRQAREGGLCIADFLRDVGSGQRDVLGLQIVSIGQRASDVAREWFAENRYQDYLYLHGLGVEMAEALAEYVHKRIRAELGFGHEDARGMDKMLRQGYRGSRYSFGYPACPNLEDQALLLRLLEAENIGVTMSDEFQLHPEQSTSAIVLHHPQAKYFSA